MKNLGKLLVWGAVVVLIIAFGYKLAEVRYYPLEYQDTVLNKSNENKISRNLIMSVIREESHFKPEQVSKAGAEGLMQIMPSTAVWIAETRGIKYDPSKIKDPEVNIDLGVWYLRYLLDQFKDETLAIEAYNAGITNVATWQKKNPSVIEFAETDQFVKRVKKSKQKYDEIYGINWEKR